MKRQKRIELDYRQQTAAVLKVLSDFKECRAAVSLTFPTDSINPVMQCEHQTF